MDIGNSSGDPVVNYTNGATISQICSGFEVTCTVSGSCGGTSTGTGGFSFSLFDFNYYKKLTIDATQVSADLVDFPVLVSLSGTDLNDGIQDSNGFDIIFATNTACEEYLLLDHQLEKYSSNGTTGELVVWVRVPNLSSAVNTDIYLFYGNSKVSVDLSVTSTWDTNFRNVLHLHNDFQDGTAYNIDGTNNSTTDLTTGKIADAQTFDNSGGNQYIDMGNPADLEFGTESWTLSAWIRTTATGQTNIISNGGDNNGGIRYVMAVGENTNGVATVTVDDNISGTAAKHQANKGSANDYNDGNWHYFVAVRDAGTILMYVDGGTPATNTGPGAGYDLSGTTQRNSYIGIGESFGGGLIKGFNGDIDEPRIAETARSADWIITEFNNQDDPAAFFTSIGTETINSCGPLPIELLNFNAIPHDGEVLVKWSTISEKDNEFFTVERSLDAKEWDVVGYQDGAINSNELIRYELTDKNPHKGLSYYRLKQTDLDGAFDYSKTVSVNHICPRRLKKQPMFSPV